MAKPRQHKPSPPPTAGNGNANGSPAIVWSRWPRVIVTLLIVLHLAAVVLAPLRVGASGESKLWQAFVWPFMPYIEAADLNHGYRFFGPDPGPSHLIRYHLEMPDGTSRDDVFPNLAEERPRLLYHRYFMLSEHLDGLHSDLEQLNARLLSAKGEGLPENSPELRQTKIADRKAQITYDGMIRSYADEILRRTGAKRVHMELIEHDFPSPDEFLNGLRLNDPSLYRKIADLGTFPEQTP